MARTWRCRRVKAGVACGTLNLRVKQRCTTCGGPRPARKQPAHRAVLEQPYEWWTEQFGSRCMICGAEATEARRLDRDHDHRSGLARGLLCHLCNRALGNRIDLAWMRSAVAYLERFEAQRNDSQPSDSAAIIPPMPSTSEERA